MERLRWIWTGLEAALTGGHAHGWLAHPSRDPGASQLILHKAVGIPVLNMDLPILDLPRYSKVENM